jgi:cytoskeletal protein CcmA (bactofilin family)
MKRFLQKMLPKLGRVKKSPRPRRGVRPQVECLEDRVTPSLAFLPKFGSQTLAPGSQNEGMQNPPVELIFWGPYWNTTQGQSDRQEMTNAAASILQGPYLTGLEQYGSDGQAFYDNYWVDPSDPSLLGNLVTLIGGATAVDTGTIRDEVQRVIDDSNSPMLRPSQYSNPPIYVVVTAPDVWDNSGWNSFSTYDYTNASGQQVSDPMHMVWLGTNTQGKVYLDYLTNAFSHEIAETVSDPDGNGIHVALPTNFPASLTGDNQIGDNEPAAAGITHYGYRLNGYMVQPYFSANSSYLDQPWIVPNARENGAFIVPDNNAQWFDLSAQWGTDASGNPTFTGTYTLTINGDQIAGNPNDVIAINTTSSGGVRATLNGEVVQFDKGVITSIVVKGGAGNDTINVEKTLNGVPLTIDLGGGHDTVNLSPVARTLDNVQGTIKIVGGTGTAALNVDDQATADLVTATTTMHNNVAFTVDPGELYRTNQVGAAVNPTGGRFYLTDIQFAGIDHLAINGGSSGNTFNVRGLADNTTLQVNGNTGVDQLIFADDNNSNTFSTTYTITSNNVTRVGRDSPVVSAYSQLFYPTHTMSVGYSGIEQLTVRGGGSGNEFDVQSIATGAPVTIYTGAGPNQVIVGDGSNTLGSIADRLTVRGGSILGTVGYNSLTLNDRGVANSATLSHNVAYTVTNGSVVRADTQTASFNNLLFQSTSSAEIDYSNVADLTIQGGGTGNAFDVQSTAPGTTTWIDAGSGNGNITVGDAANNLDGIAGTVRVFGEGGTNSLTVNDSAPRSAYLAPTQSTFAISAQLVRHSIQESNYIPGSGISSATNTANIAYSGIARLAVDAGAGNDTLQMIAIPSAGAVALDGGGGVNTLDYSGYTGDVVADLLLGSATGLSGGIQNIQNVIGSQGNDILVGNGAGNVLTGGTGRNLLISGNKAGTLLGNAGQDILVGGTTPYDTNLTALRAIMSEWTSPAAYATHVQHLLTGGGLNGPYFLNGSNFIGNGGGNTLTGAGDLDLFYGRKALDTNDWNPQIGEVFVENPQQASVYIDARALSASSLWLDGTTLVKTSTPQWFALTEGTHTLSEYYGSGSTLTFSVGANGIISYANSLAGVLSGQGTSTLTVNGRAVTINATALSTPLLTVDTGLARQTTSAFTLTILPGAQWLWDYYGSGSTIRFTVNNNGTVSYASSLAGILSGQGTSTLTVHGRAVTVNATALSLPGLTINYGIYRQTNAAFTLNLLPGAQSLADHYGSGTTLNFTVNSNGSVSYASSLAGILSGQGTSTLTVKGKSVTINATALSLPALTINYGIYRQSSAAFTLNLLPGAQSLADYYGSGSTLKFTVNSDGTVSYDPSLAGIVSGQGTSTLTVIGRAVTINATALSTPLLTVDTGLARQTTSAFTLHLLPGAQWLWDYYGSGTTLKFAVNSDGTVSYDPSLAGIVSGQGTSTLTVTALL